MDVAYITDKLYIHLENHNVFGFDTSKNMSNTTAQYSYYNILTKLVQLQDKFMANGQFTILVDFVTVVVKLIKA